jgi:phosphoserine phosphatase
MDSTRALKTMRLEPTERISHWESFSHPGFEQQVTGIDPWDHPQRARQRLLELFLIDVGSVPVSDAPLERFSDSQLTFVEDDGARSVRRGAGRTWHWDWGKHFKTIEDVLSYDPMAHLDQRNTGVVAEYDYRLDVDHLAAVLQRELDTQRAATGQRALVTGSFYNTIFMWPLLTFGWELFLELGALYEGEMRRLLGQFAERSRKAFQAFARTDVEVVISHDDICYAAGPVFRPEWLRRMIYPYYEEFWGYLHGAGKKVVFISDGNVDRVAEDVFACGADGIRSEPYTDWGALTKRHPDKILAGDGDNRVLATADRAAIFEMVRGMAARGRGCPGYFFSIGNHLPWNLPAEGIRYYFEASEALGRRQ